MCSENQLRQRLSRVGREGRLFPKMDGDARGRTVARRNSEHRARINFEPLANFPEGLQVGEVTALDSRQRGRTDADFLGYRADPLIAALAYKPAAERFKRKFFHSVLQKRHWLTGETGQAILYYK